MNMHFYLNAMVLFYHQSECIAICKTNVFFTTFVFIEIRTTAK